MLFQLSTWNPIDITGKLFFIQSTWSVPWVQFKFTANSRVIPLPSELRESQMGNIAYYISLIIYTNHFWKKYEQENN